VAVVVAELMAEKTGEIVDDARMADQLVKWPGETVQGAGGNMSVAVPPEVEDSDPVLRTRSIGRTRRVAD